MSVAQVRRSVRGPEGSVVRGVLRHPVVPTARPTGREGAAVRVDRPGRRLGACRSRDGGNSTLDFLMYEL